jgi:hypothetical protein
VVGARFVVVDERLYEPEPMAFTFAISLARADGPPVIQGRTTPAPGRRGPECNKARTAVADPRPARVHHGPGLTRRGRGSDQAIALIAAASRLLLRAALFLCTTLLSASESITLVAERNTACAAALSPAAIALRTDLIAERTRERCDDRSALRTSD